MQGLIRCLDELTPIQTIHKEIVSALDQDLDSVANVPSPSSIKSSIYKNRTKAGTFISVCKQKGFDSV